VLDETITSPAPALLIPNGFPVLPPDTVLELIVIEPVLALFIAMAPLAVPPEIVLDVTAMLPVLALFIAQHKRLEAPPVAVPDVRLTDPVLLLFNAKLKATFPVSVLALMMSIVPVEVFSIACPPLATVDPVTLPPRAMMPSSVSVPVEPKEMARVDWLNAEPVARHPASVDVAALVNVKQFALPAWM
jgi:hypothetical protein